MKVEFDTKIRRGLPITVVVEVVRDELHPTFFVDDLQVLTRSGGSCAWMKLTPAELMSLSAEAISAAKDFIDAQQQDIAAERSFYNKFGY